MTESRVWYPYTQMQALAAPVEIVRAQGAWLEARDGRRFLDGISSWWVTLHGHGEPRIAAAIARQARQLEQVILSDFTHRPAEELAERLVAIAPPGLTRVFYSDDGSTAVEVALKMALQSWQQRGAPQRHRIVALEHAYHGDTFGAMAVSAPSPFTAPFAEWLFPVERVPSALAPLAQLLEERGGEVAAVIVEPLLQGAGGMIVQPEEFLRGVRQLCDRHGALLIADEVLTGFGRTGAMFACERAGIAPDILCLSKGLTGGFLPMAATLCTEAVFAAFLSPDRRKTLFHGHSYTGNPLGCAAALASLDVFAQEPVTERIAAIAAQQTRRLQRLRGHRRVGALRQAGTVAVLELASRGSRRLHRGQSRRERPRNSEWGASVAASAAPGKRSGAAPARRSPGLGPSGPQAGASISGAPAVGGLGPAPVNGAEDGYLAEVSPRLRRYYLEQGVLLRPLGPVIYVLPPYCIQPDELDRIWDVIEASLEII